VDGLYSLRRANRSVRLAVALFLGVLGCAYVFAFLMVRAYAGLTPGQVAATYAAAGPVDAASLPTASSARTEMLDLSSMGEETHVVDTNLLIQDSHVHILLYGIVAALQTLIVLGLEWPAWWRDTVITVAFGSGLLDFAGQWLVKAGLPAFAFLTIASGWAMAAVYLIVTVGAFRALVGSDQGSRASEAQGQER
jgi:hypothetical protein